MAELESNRSRGWLWATLLIIAIAVAYLVVHSYRQTPVAVTTAQASYQDLTSTVSANGKVEPIEDFQPHAPSPGLIEKILVKVGEKVSRGQDLLRLDTSEAQNRIATARAALQGAETGLHNLQQGGTQDELLASQADLAAARTQEHAAAVTLATLQALQTKGSASANEVAVAQQHLQDAQARVAQLQARRTERYSRNDLASQQAQVVQARSALDAAQSDYSGVDIRAPFAGTVYSVTYAQYDYVNSGDPLLNLADLDRIQVRAYFDEPEIGRLANGQPVTITWEAKPKQIWHGHIIQAPTTIMHYDVRNVGECLISVDNARGDLLPNTNVTVKVTTQQKSHVLSIPHEALHTEGAENFVYKVANGHLQRVPIELGSIVSFSTAEVASGLSDGDTVVLGPVSDANLVDGMTVKTQKGQ